MNRAIATRTLLDRSFGTAARRPPARVLGLAELGPIDQLRGGRLARRLSQLVLGLVLYGVSIALMVLSGLGAMPWDVLHTGLAAKVHLTIGQVVVLASLGILLLWIPLRERPGLGTLANTAIIGPVADLVLAVVPAPGTLPGRIAVMVAAVVLCAIASALYIGSQFGRGPRDGLMTGLARRTGLSVRLVRTVLEVTLVGIGLLLGGIAGAGTVVYALAIGPLVQLMLPRAIVPVDPPNAAGARNAGAVGGHAEERP